MQNGAGRGDVSGDVSGEVSGDVLVSDLLSSPVVVRISVDAVDNCGAPNSRFVMADDFDTTPLSISVSLDPDTLWPPNHKLVDIVANVVATHNCPGVSFVLESLTSDEPDNGIADSNMINDIQNAESGTLTSCSACGRSGLRIWMAAPIPRPMRRRPDRTTPSAAATW